MAALALAFAGGAAAADDHGYPRTFHVWGGWYGAEALADYDMVVGYESNWDVGALRALNPDGIFLLSPGLYPRQGARYGQLHVTSGAAEEWPGGRCPEPIGYVPAFEPAVDFLRRPHGSLARVGGAWSHTGFNLARRQTAEKIAGIFACAALEDGLYTRGWDGVWSDNWIHTIGTPWFFGSPLDTNLDGVADAPADLRRRWDNGLAIVGETLRELLPGKTVGGNGTWYGSRAHQGDDPASWLGEANVTLMEYQNSYYRRPAEFVGIVNRWLAHPDPTGLTRYFAVEQAAMTADGKKFASTGDPNAPENMLDPGVMKGMRWGLTLSLMTGAYFEVNPDQLHDARWWYDEYDGGVGVRERGYLGDPLAAPQKLVGAVWRRDFEHGVALNNSTEAAVTVQLEDPYRHLRGTQNPSLNDGSTVTEVTIPAHDGVVLLRTVPPDLPPPPPDSGPGTTPPPPGAGPGRPIARIARVRVPRRGRLVFRVRGAEGARIELVVRNKRGRLLARAERRIGERGAVRCRLRFQRYNGGRNLRVQMRGHLEPHSVEARMRLRLSRRGHRIIRSTTSVR